MELIISIRQMEIEDIGAVIGIEEFSFSMPWSLEAFLNEFYDKQSIKKVADINETVVGYIIVKQIIDEGYLLNLAVRGGLRGLGIAKRLLENTLFDLKSNNCKYCYLEVRDSNFQAKRLYVDFGFKTIGIRKSYYIKPVDDALVMKLGL